MRHLVIIFLAALLLACGNRSNGEHQASKPLNQDSLINDTITVPIKIRKAMVHTKLPDFTQYTDTQEKKKAFFDFLRPMVEEENDKIRKDRAKIIDLFDSYQQSKTVSPTDSIWLANQAKTMRMKRFDISEQDKRNELLRKVDIVPASLFLAQAANESSWGTSRFATQANNLFGQWCLTPGCGIVPAQRGTDDKHEVRKFRTVNDAVNSYVRNINSNNAYKELRKMREEMRNKGEEPNGTTLAGGLFRYSVRGEAYVKEIRGMIRFNKLEGQNQ